MIKDVVEEENFELSQEGQPNINTSEAALKLSAQLAPDTVAEKITMPVVDKVVLPMPDEIGEKEASLDVMSAEAEFVPVNTQVVETAEIDVIDDVEPIDDSTVVASSLIEEINVEEIPVIVSSIDMQEIDSLRARLQEMERELSKTKTRYEKTIHGLKSQILTLKSENHSAVRQRSASKQKKKLEKKPASNSSVWELRAAQPGRAWVSKVGKKDMRPVVVGDILPGMGRIRDITYQNSKWVVVGSEGKIVQ